MAVSGTETNTARQSLIQQREQALVELSGLGLEPSRRQALERADRRNHKELVNFDQSSLNRARTMLTDSEKATTSVEISEAESNLEQMESAEKGIEEELRDVKATAATFGAKYGQAVSVRKLEREGKDLQDLQERMIF